MIYYCLMALSICFAVANSCLLHRYSDRVHPNSGEVFLFNAGGSVVWAIILAIWFFVEGNLSVQPLTLLFGLIYGVILCLFLLFKTRSMAEGPVSLTTLIGSSAFIIATWFGVFYANDPINAFQIIGMIILLLSLVLCVNPKKSGEVLTLKWFLYCLAFFFAGGLVGMLYKVFGKSPVHGEVNAMMLTASIVSAILFFICGRIITKKTGAASGRPDRVTLFYLVLCGIASCVYIRLNISLSNVIPSPVFFPVSNGAMVILSTVAGKLFFREKLKRIQITGIVIGLIAIIITGCGQTLWELFVR